MLDLVLPCMADDPKKEHKVTVYYIYKHKPAYRPTYRSS